MQRELELKVELSKSDVERLGGELPVGDLSVGPATTKKLRTVYFDTPKHSSTNSLAPTLRYAVRAPSGL